MPFSVTVWGPPKASSLIVRVALSATGLLGLNVTKTEQLAPAATLLPQLLVVVKSELLVEIPLMCSGTGLPLVKVSFCAAVGVPIWSQPKLSVLVDTVAVGAFGYQSREVPLAKEAVS